MAFLGNAGLVLLHPPLLICRHSLTVGCQPTGNGPISNVAPFLSSPNSAINLIGVRAEQIDRMAAFANATGIWSFFDLSLGIYFASEAGASRQWQIDVAADLTFTVTPITSSFPQDVSSISIG